MTVTGYGKKTLAIWFLLMLAAAWVSSDSYTMLGEICGYLRLRAGLWRLPRCRIRRAS